MHNNFINKATFYVILLEFRDNDEKTSPAQNETFARNLFMKKAENVTRRSFQRKSQFSWSFTVKISWHESCWKMNQWKSNFYDFTCREKGFLSSLSKIYFQHKVLTLKFELWKCWSYKVFPDFIFNLRLHCQKQWNKSFVFPSSFWEKPFLLMICRCLHGVIFNQMHLKVVPNIEPHKHLKKATNNIHFVG